MWQVLCSILVSQREFKGSPDRLHAEAIRWEHRAPEGRSSQWCKNLIATPEHAPVVFWCLLGFPICKFSKIVAKLNHLAKFDHIWTLYLEQSKFAPLPSQTLSSTSVGRPLWRSQKFLKQKLRPKGPWDEFLLEETLNKNNINDIQYISTWPSNKSNKLSQNSFLHCPKSRSPGPLPAWVPSKKGCS